MKPSLFQRLFHKRIRRLRVSVNMEGLPRAVQNTLICGKGLVKFGAHVLLGWKNSPSLRTTETYIEARTRGSVIEIGEGCIFNNGAALVSVENIVIGKRCLFGPNFRCYDSDFHGIAIKDRNNAKSICNAPVYIGDDCWIGDSVTVLKGVRLGAGCVVAACSVVTKSFPENSLIAGNPAKLVRTIEQEKCDNDENI